MTHLQFATSTLGEIVARDFRAAAIFDRYGLDYCCGGDRSLADSCRQRGVSAALVVSELETLEPGSRETPAPQEDPAALVEYIVSRHHAYVRQALPAIQQHLAKVVAAHGGRHPELQFIESQFANVADELLLHMTKEEQVLFPYIHAMAVAGAHGGPLPPDMFGTVQNPIRMMEREHQEAGEGMAAIRELSHNYRTPQDACSTFRLVFAELEAFEQDLHQHVHLENHVLFPKAIDLEANVARRSHALKAVRWR